MGQQSSGRIEGREMGGQPSNLFAGSTLYLDGADHHHSLDENLESIKRLFPLRDGYFGTKSKKRVRHIRAVNPEKKAMAFFKMLAYGGVGDILGPGKYRARMAGGDIVVLRIHSHSDGSPAIDLTIVSCSSIKNQKIHFIKREK